MTRFRGFLHDKKYKEPLFKRIALVIFAFAVMIATSSIMAGHIVGGRLRDQAEAVVNQAITNIEADFSGPMTAVNIMAETIRGMILRGSDADAVRTYLIEASMPLQGQNFGLHFNRVYGYFDTLDGGSFLDSVHVGKGGDADEDEDEAEDDDESEAEDEAEDDDEDEAEDKAPGKAENMAEKPPFNPMEQLWYTAAIEADGALAMTQVRAGGGGCIFLPPPYF